MTYRRQKIETFPSIASRVQTFLAQTRLDTLTPSSFTIYGSSVRAFWTHEPAVNINLAFRTLDGLTAAQPLMKQHPAFAASPRLVPEPEQLLAESDFTVCQIAFHDGRFVLAQDYFERLAERTLIVHHLSPSTALATLLRAYKYSRRGFGINYNEVLKILQAIPKHVAPLSAHDAAHHSGGIVG